MRIVDQEYRHVCRWNPRNFTLFSPSGSLPTSYMTIFTLLCSLVVLFAGAAKGQGFGLYKGDEKILDLEEISTDEHEVSPKESAYRNTQGLELYQRVLGERQSSRQQPLSIFMSLVMSCQHNVEELSFQRETGAIEETLLEELVVLEPALRAAHQRVLDYFVLREENLLSRATTGPKVGRLLDFRTRHNMVAEELLTLMGAFLSAHMEENVFARDRHLRDLERYFHKNNFHPDLPLHPSEQRPLPMELLPPSLSHETRAEALAAVAYPLGHKGHRYDPADLSETIDVRFTSEIVSLADSLDQSPVAMYYFVRDNVEFEAYLGSRKGGQQTLSHRRGNDYDQASLLISLMRSSGIPARYASGVAYMPMDRATNWLGINDKSNAGSLLATAGMEGMIHIASPDTVAISCRRVWVEAWVPFANYRGAVNDSTGYRWVPLDPTFKQYTYEASYNLPAEIDFDAEVFVNEYISTFIPETPGAVFEQLLANELPGYHPGADLADLVPRRTVVKEPDGILPGTLPYELLSYDGTFVEISADKRYQIRFHLYNGGTNLDYTTSIPEIVEKQVTISYVGATTADQLIIDEAGGIFNVADPFLVDLVPVLKIDGCEVARGSGSIMMGTTHNSDMHFTAPTGAGNQIPLVANVIIAGNYQGIGIDTEDALPTLFDLPATSCTEDILGQELHQTTLTYLNNVDIADDRIADYMHMVIMNDVAEAIVENSVTVYWSGGLPITFDWDGMIIDADRKIIGPFARDGQLAPCQHMRLGGADGSVQENRVFELRYDEEAISTIKILSLAADSLIPVCEIISSISADCPGLDQPPEVISAINDALDLGHHVIIPQRQFTYYDWTGTAWIDMDPVTCAAGYIISGGHNGGETVQEWDIYIPGLECLFPEGDIDVEPLGAGPDNDLFCAESNERWTFIVNDLHYLSSNSGDNPCSVMLTENKRFVVTNYTIKELAEDPRFGPGEYTFRIGETGDCGDCMMKEKTVAILKIDMIAYRPTTDGPAYGNPFGRHPIDDDQEENPGAGIRINQDTEVDTSENDLIEVELDIGPFPVLANVQYYLRRSNNNIKVWDTQQMSNALLDSGAEEAAITISGLPISVWVENPSGGVADLELVVKGSSGGDVCSDKVHFYNFESIVIGLSGEALSGGNPLDNGMFNVADDLYNRGYDVHYYDEDVVSDTGHGAAYNEVFWAITDRGVTHVAIYGHSHGGGSTHDLAERLDANRAAIGVFTIDITAYVDAIQNDHDYDIDSELRYPPSSLSHLNYYQPNGWLHGGVVPGALNLDVTTTQWGRDLDHWTIDNDPNVRNAVRDIIIQQIPQP